MIYFDTGATTKPTSEVINDIVWCLENVYGNPSSIHDEGYKARQILEQSREKVAAFINAEPSEIIFTSGASEANNLAIKGFLDEKFNIAYKNIVSTKLEHPSVYNTCKYMNSKGYGLFYVENDPFGMIHSLDLKKTLNMNKIVCPFVSIMLGNNEVGSINNIKRMSEITHEMYGVIHTDATQALSQIPIDVKDLGVDLLSASGHKFNIPKGIGFLYKKDGIRLSPIIHGGGQENNYRAGTENIPYIYAMANQLERIKDTLQEDNKWLRRIHNYLIKGVFENCTKYVKIIYINGNPKRRLPGNLSLTFVGVDAETLITLLSLKGVYVSAGAACSVGQKTPSRVLTAMGISAEEATNTIRITFGKDTTYDMCDEFIRILGECLQSIQMI